MVQRYADAFGVDRGRDGCWRYVPDSGGRPERCTGRVMCAGFVAIRQRRWRVWSCDGHLDGGEQWIRRPDASSAGAAAGCSVAGGGAG